MTQTAVCLPARGSGGAARSTLTYHVDSLLWLFFFPKYFVFIFLTPAEQITSEVTFNWPGFIPFSLARGGNVLMKYLLI